jgi:hypothetical protein
MTLRQLELHLFIVLYFSFLLVTFPPLLAVVRIEPRTLHTDNYKRGRKMALRVENLKTVLFSITCPLEDLRFSEVVKIQVDVFRVVTP